MRYTFELNQYDDRYELKIDVGLNGSLSGMVHRSLSTPITNIHWDDNLKDLLMDMMDNMKLTVAEHKEAHENVKILLDYIMGNYQIKDYQIEDKPINEDDDKEFDDDMI